MRGSKMLLMALFVVLLVAVTAGILLFQVLGWLAVVLVPMLAVALMASGMQPILAELVLLPLRNRGASLRGATITIHNIHAATPPAIEDRGEGVDAGLMDRIFFHVDLSVAPRSRGGSATAWEPGALCLVRPNHPVTPTMEPDDVCVVARVDRFENGAFEEEQEGVLAGPQRLRLLVGVRPPASRLVIRYYLESLGEVGIPSSMVPVPVRGATMPS